MNKITILGRFIEKPTIAYTTSNKAILKSTIAVNRNYKNANGEYETDFIRIVAFDKKAETIANYFDKGSRILISGRLQTGSYDDKEGNKRYTSDVMVEEIDFIDKKESGQAVQTKPTFTADEVDSMRINDDPFADFGEQISLDDSDLD